MYELTGQDKMVSAFSRWQLWHQYSELWGRHLKKRSYFGDRGHDIPQTVGAKFVILAALWMAWTPVSGSVCEAVDRRHCSCEYLTLWVDSTWVSPGDYELPGVCSQPTARSSQPDSRRKKIKSQCEEIGTAVMSCDWQKKKCTGKSLFSVCLSCFPSTVCDFVNNKVTVCISALRCWVLMLALYL